MSFEDLQHLSEGYEIGTRKFLFTSFAAFDADDVAYFGQLEIPKLKITMDQSTSLGDRVGPDAKVVEVVSITFKIILRPPRPGSYGRQPVPQFIPRFVVPTC
jgi:hypothetical protein